MRSDRTLALQQEIICFRQARAANRVSDCWAHLARAHILAQPDFWDHIAVHARMFGFAVATSNVRELGGQAKRLMLAPIGNVTGKLPMGNTGLSNVSAFQPMGIPADLAHIFTDKRADV